jgi:putative copper resistance protein D
VTDTIFTALAVARWTHFIALLVAFGASLFPFYACAAGAGPNQPILASGRRILTLAALVRAVSAAGWCAASIANVAGDWSGPTDLDVLSSFFIATSFGGVWLVRLGLAAALATMIVFARAELFARNPATAIFAALAAALLASQAWIGHPAGFVGLDRWIVTSAYVAHVLGAGFWFGGLFPLGMLLAQARTTNGKAAVEIEYALRRFSAFAMCAVALTLAGGATNAIYDADLLRGAADTLWSRLLLTKIAIVAGMLGAASINRFILMPGFARGGEGPLTFLARNVTFEKVAGMIVLAAAAVLGILPPG